MLVGYLGIHLVRIILEEAAPDLPVRAGQAVAHPAGVIPLPEVQPAAVELHQSAKSAIDSAQPAPAATPTHPPPAPPPSVWKPHPAPAPKPAGASANKALPSKTASPTNCTIKTISATSSAEFKPVVLEQLAHLGERWILATSIKTDRSMVPGYASSCIPLRGAFRQPAHIIPASPRSTASANRRGQ
jgi:hypothetical protein